MTDEALDFTTEYVEAAIKELKNNSAPGPDGVPAVLLKNCSVFTGSDRSIDVYVEEILQRGSCSCFL